MNHSVGVATEWAVFPASAIYEDYDSAELDDEIGHGLLFN